MHHNNYDFIINIYADSNKSPLVQVHIQNK